MEQIKEAVYLINDERYLHLRENGTGVGFATYNKVTGEPLESGQISEKNLPPDGRNAIPAARNWYLFELSDDDRKVIQQESVKILENIPQAGIGRRRIWEPETLPKDIRLINSHYDDLYRIPDGGVIQVDYPDGRSFTARVEHLDDYHFDMGGLGNVFHICQFAEVMERNHADFYPEIQTQDEQTDESRDEFKVNHVAQKIAEYVAEGKKTLVYCPFRSTVDSIYQAVPFSVKDKVRRYHAGMERGEKNAAQDAFKNNKAIVMICTKAFGMGVDVPDIVQVYHYAPTGNLADYVQEIGRCARDKNLRGTAVEEYLPGDLSQLKRLHGMGELRQFQLREMLHKLYWMYSQKKHRNLLVSPDAFSYLFDSGEVENRVKTGLLLLARDLEEAYGFPVLVVRPKAMFTTCYANVPEEIEEEFLAKYGDFVKNLYDNTVTVNRSFSPLASDVVVRNSGSIYEIRMGDLWEKYFSDMTFGMFKAKFFKGELFAQDGTNRISVRVKTQIHYGQDFDTTRAKLRQYMEAVAQVFDGYRKEHKMFTAEEFRQKAQEALGAEVLNADFAKALLELFVMDVQADPTRREGDRMKFIQATQRGWNRIGLLYRVTNGNYFSMANWMDQKLVNCAPNREETEYMGYIPATIGGKQNTVMRLLAVLEIFGLASYEVRGGQNLEIFVRVNDPQKIRSLSEDRRYKNLQLQEIHRRHVAAENMMTAFLTSDLTTKQRWDLIEDYFLGHDEVVAQVLGLNEEN